MGKAVTGPRLKVSVTFCIKKLAHDFARQVVCSVVETPMLDSSIEGDDTLTDS